MTLSIICLTTRGLPSGAAIAAMPFTAMLRCTACRRVIYCDKFECLKNLIGNATRHKCKQWKPEQAVVEAGKSEQAEGGKSAVNQPNNEETEEEGRASFWPCMRQRNEDQRSLKCFYQVVTVSRLYMRRTSHRRPQQAFKTGTRDVCGEQCSPEPNSIVDPNSTAMPNSTFLVSSIIRQSSYTPLSKAAEQGRCRCRVQPWSATKTVKE